jgi:phage-related protein (TIGR01555 family)
MFKRLLDWLRAEPPASVPTNTSSRADKYESGGVTSRLLREQREVERRQAEAFTQSVKAAYDSIKVWRPPVAGAAMDAKDPLVTLSSAMDDDNGLPFFKQVAIEAGSQLSLMPWFMRQGFIGYQNAAFIAQHWLVYKACAVPVDDAIRNGYDITTVSGEDLPEDALKVLKSADRRVGLQGQLRDFGTKGRIFGIRIALFEVESKDPAYYEKPFNLDGVAAGSYKGISQVDPYWCAPILDITAAAVPSGRHFYEPTWWLIGSRRVHRSHLVIFRYADPPDVLKPLYLFGGIPLPQMIMERVYCAERTANEAPALALSKRTTVWLTNMANVMADSEKAERLMREWIAMRDNFGIKLGDKEGDEFEQFDTPLADFDGLVMTQYGLVAATAGCPITKLLGTTPGGFAATGDYDESSYHELLESMQERDFTPLAQRHHALVMRSEVVTKFPALKDAEIVVKWHELDAMTHVEQAQVNLNKAETDATLIATGALTPADVRARIATDKESGYHGIGKDLETEDLDDLDDDPDAAAEAAGPGRRAAKADVERQQDRGKTNGKKPADR